MIGPRQHRNHFARRGGHEAGWRQCSPLASHMRSRTVPAPPLVPCRTDLVACTSELSKTSNPYPGIPIWKTSLAFWILCLSFFLNSIA